MAGAISVQQYRHRMVLRASKSNWIVSGSSISIMVSSTSETPKIASYPSVS